MKLFYVLSVAALYWLGSTKLISKGEIDSLGAVVFFSLAYLIVATITASIIFTD